MVKKTFTIHSKERQEMQTVIDGVVYITKFYYSKLDASLFEKIYEYNGNGERVKDASGNDVYRLGNMKPGLNSRKRKGRTTTCEISILTAPNTLEKVSESKVTAHRPDDFEKVVGRRVAFEKALLHDSLKDHQREFMLSFRDQCPASFRVILESVREL